MFEHLKKIRKERRKTANVILRIIFIFYDLILENKNFEFRKRLFRFFNKLKYNRIIDHMMIEVCSVCQNDCEFCCNSSLIKYDKAYQLSLEELKTFTYYTKKSKYYVEKININGAGEPTLWKYLNEGMKLLHDSRIAKSIVLETNGQSLNRINNKTWKYLSKVIISDYPSNESINLRQQRFKEKIDFINRDLFRVLPNKKHEDTIPCFCICPGPMFVKDKVFLYCGPPVFNAADIMRVGVSDQNELYAKVELNYMDKLDEKKIGNLQLCEYCWANSNIKLPSYEHKKKKIINEA